MKRLLLLLLLAALPAAHAANAAPVLRFCSLDIDFAPVARVDGTGHYQYLLQLAARKAGIRVPEIAISAEFIASHVGRGLRPGVRGRTIRSIKAQSATALT